MHVNLPYTFPEVKTYDPNNVTSNNIVWTYPQGKLMANMANMENSTSITKISVALLKAQKNMGDATKDAKNPFFKSSYADLNAVREACMPALNAEGISVLQPTVVKDGKTFVRTLLLHESGEYLGSDTEVVCAKVNDPQAYGSGISYARRYGLQAFLNVGAVDDDGEAAMGRSKAPAKAATKVTLEHISEPVTVAKVEAPVVQAEAAPAAAPAKPSFRKTKAKTETPALAVSSTPTDGTLPEGWQ